mgnify:CR=1 FL=1
MIEVTIEDLPPNEVIEIVRELRSSGLVQGQDFDFRYVRPEWSEIGDIERHTVFSFYNEKYGTFFALKYSK